VNNRLRRIKEHRAAKAPVLEHQLGIRRRELTVTGHAHLDPRLGADIGRWRETPSPRVSAILTGVSICAPADRDRLRIKARLAAKPPAELRLGDADQDGRDP